MVEVTLDPKWPCPIKARRNLPFKKFNGMVAGERRFSRDNARYESTR
jgi:hypothetical protein